MDEFLFPDNSRENESLILYKLIILYMLNAINSTLSSSHISDFMLSKNIATYFTIQETINELVERKLIKAEKIRHSTIFTLTKRGAETLDYYENIIPDDIIESIKNYSKENKLELRQQLSIVSTYEPSSNQEFVVHCTIKEKNSPIFELSLNAPDKEMAEKICDNWQKNHEQLYSDIMQGLLG